MASKDIRNVTRRFVLQVGFSCNARCRFCYYKESLRTGKVRDYTTLEIKSKLIEGISLGKNMIDISGGEPTIRHDIFEIIKYARDIGYKRVCLITNGIKMSNPEFCDKLIEAGMNEILFSIHSPVENDHDWLTCVKGSYKKIITALEYLGKKKGVSIRINSTISGFNYETIDKLFELLRPYDLDAINILILNPSNETLYDSDKDIVIIDYNIVGKKVSDSINKYKQYFKVINIRWIPFCLMKGHEERIRTMWQKMYEDEEWDTYMNIKYNKGILAVIASLIAGSFLYPFKAPKYGKRDLYTLFNEIQTTFRGVYYYIHPKECKICSLRKICPGLPRDYINKLGINMTKLSPYQLGKVIEDPLYFCREYKNNFESLRLSENIK